MGFDFAGYEQLIAVQAEQSLALADTPGEMAGAMKRLFRRVEEDLAAHQGEEARHIACAEGCGTCCTVNVAVLIPEAIAICHYLTEARSSAELGALGRGLDELDRETRWLDDEERIVAQRPCAFLDARGACSIYPVRPLLCRSVTSTDAERCREAICGAVFGEQVPVLMNLFQKSLMESAFAGLARGLELAGLDAGGGRLTGATRQLLDEPALADAFLAGEPFPRCSG
ncbi:zinc/iron-chelating domain-containing protein [Desulfuromonas versatilis]|uniref:Zinc/iron-chelating domain-containing protein n=1 Tax=Desulfuromonas versatilis TaxID=2802975 RepID=A0ABM8HQ78_9BACT|nr:YkgJ family cysteine cluster protein [Desulfuromonas versatilis]BCR03901.1 zinc/iron-chelating domain-containing protein [Desulfuromonas versatilis]